MSCHIINLRRMQVCKACDPFCKLAFVAKWPRRHDAPWYFARTDIGCPRSRAKKCALSRAGRQPFHARTDIACPLFRYDIRMSTTETEPVAPLVEHFFRHEAG